VINPAPNLVVIELDYRLMTHKGQDVDVTGQIWIDLNDVGIIRTEVHNGETFTTTFQDKRNGSIVELGPAGSKSFFEKWERYCAEKDLIRERDLPAQKTGSLIATPLGEFNPNGGRIVKI